MTRKTIIVLASVFMFIQVFATGINDKTKITLWVDGACGMCQDRIEKAAKKTSGVLEAQWNVDNHLLTVTVDDEKFDLNTLHTNLAKSGHDTEIVKADENVYNKLPLCCQYKSEDNPHTMQKNAAKASESTISGVVFETHDDHDHVLVGATLFLINSKTATVTDGNGHFELKMDRDKDLLAVSYVGYRSDTIEVSRNMSQYLQISLMNSAMLDEIEITHRNRTTTFSYVEPIKVQRISVCELKKAACCNLSESFETNPSVDVSFTDAVTGSKVIEMLGLAGKYVMISRENVPYVRGLASIYGMAFIPGPWIESIQMIKGTGSVVNGYESMTGQINVEYFKPLTAPPLFLNLYASTKGTLEANFNGNIEVNRNLSTGLLLHGSYSNTQNDHNNDGFLDEPYGANYAITNRWQLELDNGIISEFGIDYVSYDKTSGQVGNENDISGLWKAKLENRRFEPWIRFGKIFNDKFDSSLGLQISSIYHDQKNRFGNRIYNGLQRTLYTNLIFRSNILSEVHTYKTGVSFVVDDIDETVNENQYARKEQVPGMFFEYSFIPNSKFTAVGGIRADYSNYTGLFFTPRMNLKYSVTDRLVLRAAIGRGQRTSNIFAENIGHFASSRQFIIIPQNTDNPYGLDPEVSWNYGLNMLTEFTLFGKNSVFSLDYYYSDFKNQIVVDLENPREVRMYNLKGKSFSNSIQTQFDIEIFDKFDVRLAYRFNDVKTQYDSGLLEKPLSSRNRAFINFGYETPSGWKFDYTLNYQCGKRIPNTLENPQEYQLDLRSPGYFTMNAQVSKVWSDIFEFYVGGENLSNYKQPNPIIAAHDPFGNHFDASLIWGPVMGRNIYAGLRYYIQRK